MVIKYSRFLGLYMLEIDTRDIDYFLEEKKKIYPQLNDIFNALCWRM